MLSKNICCTLVLLLMLQSYNAERRIIGGHKVTTDKAYVVYLTKAWKSPRAYDYWLCGGSLVTTWYIVTSAACVEDVEFMYAIAGYRKYVQSNEIDKDPCTKETKKKIIYTCIPKKYDFDYEKIEKWSYIDIAIVKVESEYNFNDPKYLELCSYKPKVIEINYDTKYQEPDTDAIVFGWGHVEKWRKPEDSKDYNQEYLQYASTTILNKKECKTYFTNFTDLGNIIEKYMICTLEKGNINEKGDAINKPTLLADGCTPVLHLLSAGELACEEDETIIMDDTRRTNVMARILQRQQSARREGICQNDHGGPLVSWMGGHEMLIGVASVFRVTNDSRCSGPFLFTSTQCNGMFLDCIINADHKKDSHEKNPSGEKDKKENSNEHHQEHNFRKADTDIPIVNKSKRKALCDSPPSEKGFDTSVRHISWMNHPDGPAANELVMRPQIPIRNV